MRIKRIIVKTATVVVGAGLLIVGATTGAQAVKKDKDENFVRPSDLVKEAPDTAWRDVDQANTLYMDLPTGQVVIELRPDFAPGHIERIKTLTKDGFYNGLQFHRVIEGFMAQGGDPKGDGTGGSDLPNILGEFTRDAKTVNGFSQIGRDRIASRIGFVDGLPAAAQPLSLGEFRADGKVDLWGLHCPGVMSMARAGDPNSANSQFFLMIGDQRLNLDKRYTVWGQILDGFEHSRRIMRGEPPSRPTPIVRMRTGDDVPEGDRVKIQVMRTDSEAFIGYLDKAGKIKEGLARDICDIKVPVRVNGEIEL